MNQLEFLNTLHDLFKNLDNSTAYLSIETGQYFYRQRIKITRLPYCYFDIKKSGFLILSDIISNREVMSKILEYSMNYLICQIPTKRGFEFYVYNNTGALIYTNEIKFFSDLNVIFNHLYKLKYPDLVLSPKVKEKPVFTSN